jgi:hypothetical protein
MTGNKQVYQAAYDRALEGRSRPVWELLMAPFEDTYSRQSREQGERDGAAARVRQAQQQ